ncbi:RHS repeat-associated core domain-containing protein [Amycolatopsis silviterrae]|uniref:RHS repeat-associated core domain-containing protein n=1 Tax=Amycolatopsis silviterrae TaxID=1656914 RepID=A0ABW5HHZ8_9PSEU
MSNPLVAPVKDSTTAMSGVPLLEDAETLKQGIESKNWASVAIGAVGTALDVLTAVMDPFGAIFAAGVGWLMEHVGPLKEALDALTGNADEIKSQAETWTNVAKELEGVSAELTELIKKDLESWQGEAADAYRKRAADTAALIGSAQKGSEGAASGVKTAGEIVAAVRSLVRDTIADLVGHLISWALQVLFTAGIGMAWVVPQVVTAVAKTASTIAKVTSKLVKALKALIPLLKKAGVLFKDAAKSLKGLKGGKGAPAPKPKDINVKSDKPRSNPKEDESVSTSGDHSGGGGNTHSSGDRGGNHQPGSEGTRGEPGGSGGSGGRETGGDRVDPQGARETRGDGGRGADPAKTKDSEGKCTGLDPVDLATGDLLFSEIDLFVPGDLGALVVREHVSSYRDGQWFGPSWTSVFDERLELADGVVKYFSADAMVLSFPYPRPGTTGTVPEHGPLRRLSVDADAYLLDDPGREQTRRFLPHPQRPDVLLLNEIYTYDGETVTVGYDENGVPAELAHSAGARLRVDAADGRIRAVHAAGPAAPVLVARYGYDERGHLSVRHNSSPVPARYTHDAEGRLVSWTDHAGHWYRQVYDARGRVVQAVGEGGYLSGSVSYAGNRTVLTDSLGHRKTFEFDPDGDLLSETDRTGGVTRFEWGRYNKLSARTDPLGRRTEFEHDETGRLAAVKRPDGSRVEILVHTSAELVIGVREGERLLRRTYRAPLPDPYTDALGSSADQDRSAAEAPSPLSAPAENRDRDLFGRPRVVRNAAGGRETRSWSVEGTLRSLVQPDGARYEWVLDGEGAPVRSIDPLNRASITEYGPFRIVTATVDPAGARTVRRYDTELRQVAVVNPAGQTWEFSYDAEGRMIAQSDFGGRVSQYEYDAAGQQTRAANAAGETVACTYDLLGNLVRRESAARVDEYRYDAVGNVVHAAGPDAETTIEYDEIGRAVRQVSGGRTTTFAYDGESGVTRRTPSGAEVAWARGADGVDTLSVTGVELTLKHDAAGRLASVRDSEKTLLQQHFDLSGQLIGQQTPAGARQYHRRPDGSVSSRDDAAGHVRYDHDQVGRVTAVHSPRGAEQYRYDVLGDLVSSSPGTGAEAGPRRYDGGLPETAGAVSYTHDAQGRMTSRTVAVPGGPARTWAFAWDPGDQLVGVRTPDGDRWRYRYDSLDRRVAKQRLDAAGRVAEQVEFVWDGTQLIETLHTVGDSPATVLTWAHHPDDDRPVAQVPTGADGAAQPVAVLVTDAVGTPVETVGSGGGEILRTSLWGLSTGGEPTPLRFPGQYYDAETGLHFNVFRYYDPGNARYLNPDPLGLEPSPNPLAYVSDPLRYADPLGLTGIGDDLGNYAPDRTGLKRKCKGNQSGNSGQPAQNGQGSSAPPAKKPRTPKPGGSGKPARTGPNEWDQTPHGPINGKRHESQGGGTGTGELHLDGSKNHSTKSGGAWDNHCTDVPQINDAARNGKLTPEFKQLLGNSEMIKGHMHTEGLGGAGDSANLTPLSKKANSTMSGNFEKPLANAEDKLHLMKGHGRVSDATLTTRGYSPQEIARLNKKLDDLQIDFSVTPSKDLKLPNSTNAFEQSVHDKIELRSNLNVDPELDRFLSKEYGRSYAELKNHMPGNLDVDTMSGRITRR